MGVRTRALLPAPARHGKPRRADPRARRRGVGRPGRAVQIRPDRPRQQRDAPDAERPPLLRHRPHRPRLLLACALRDPNDGADRIPRRDPLDDHRHCNRRDCRLLQRVGRQRPDALHRPDPDATRPRCPAHRRGVLRHRQAISGGRDPRLALLDGAGAHCARQLSRCGRRSTSKQRKRQAPPICESCFVTCSRTPSGRSSSTRR